jgi:tRNA pseudouridine32 synthase/23S rRNA pseudouridine746 synthase
MHNPPDIPEIIELHLPVAEAGVSAVEMLAAASGLSRQQIKQAMQKGAVWLGRGRQTHHLRRATATPAPGDTLHLYYNRAVLAEVPPPPVLIADEGGYSIWYKPYGLRSQGTKWADHCAINRWLEQHLTPQRPAFIVHRLDRAASGLIIVAHSKTLAAAFSKLFRERAIIKRYRAVVHGEFPHADTPIRLDAPLDEKPSVSYARRLEYDSESRRSLLEVEIETGRKHQIRRHLATAGFPVVGDRLYGRAGDGEDLQLSAVELIFTCPIDGADTQYRLEPGRAGCPIAVLFAD